MIIAPDHPKEEERLSALLRYEVLDSEDEAAFDELTQLAAYICETPFALFNLMDNDRLWCKSRVGLDVHETSRDITFCSHTILQEDIFEVGDAARDERFYDNPFVVDEPKLRFYAGIPLFSEEHLPIGTLCVLDPRPKELTPDQQRVLRVLAKQVITQLEMRLNRRRLERMNQRYETMIATLAHDLSSPFNGILGCAQLLSESRESLSVTEIDEMAEGIYLSSMKVYQLLDELMQWTRVNMGAVPKSLDRCNATVMLNDTVEFLDDVLKLKRLHLVNRLPDDLYLRGNTALLKTILRNLITNAVKYSPEGGTVFVEYHSTSPRSVDISITDEGRGFPRDVINRLLHTPVESGYGSKGELGYGLGLNLCKNLAEIQGGEIFIDAAYDHGGRIIVRMGRA